MTTALPFQTQQPAFARMGDPANFVNMSFEQQESYMRSLDTWRTNMAAEEFTFNKGVAEGIEKGRATIARSMKADGVSIDIIVRYTGLTPEQIEGL